MSTFYKLSVKEVKKETENAVSIVFDIPSDLQQEFNFVPGQYITIKKEFDGKEVRRAYSICSSKGSNTVRIGVKKVEEGSFSVYASTILKVGEVLEVSPPEGRFILQPDVASEKNYLAFAAGSGITPILSMIKSVAETETKSKFVLIYGNRSPKEVMFKEEMDLLKADYPDRIFVEYLFSRSNEDDALVGRIDTSTVNYALNNKYKSFDFDQFFLCGPELMINTVKKELIEKGFSENDIYFELFSTEIEEESAAVDHEGESIVTIVLDEEEETFSMDKKKTILEEALKRGIDAPYSCQGAICSSCLAQITEGKAIMDKNTILTDSEVEEGLVLTCQAHPITNKITIDYDAV